MAAVTELAVSEVLSGANIQAYRVTIATTADTLETPFSTILNVQATPETTTASNLVFDYDISGGTITFNGSGTGFAGNWSILVIGLL